MILAIFHIVFHSFAFYRTKRAIAKDLSAYDAMSKEVLLGLDTNKDFKTEYFKDPSELTKILSPWYDSTGIDVKNEDLKEVIGVIEKVKNGEVADLRKYKLPKDNGLFLQNELNRLDAEPAYAYEILKTKGYALEDFYGEEWEKRYKDCVADSRINKREIPIKELVRLILKSAVETGTPFAFNRDHANKTNPNPHKGMIYCSNLCTEISQNMSEIKHKSIEIKTEDGDTLVVTTTIPGDFVVCNLASLVLGNIDLNDEKEIDTIVSSAVRALDNVIDLNFYPIPYAQITNSRYRSIGLGASGYHHALAKNGIAWESEEHLNFADKVFERINYAAIKASSQIAKEKGSYSYFEGSDWQTGEYFKKRNYVDEKWKALAEEVKSNGMRNAYLLAVAPTSSTSIIAGTTAGVDPIMNKYFLEEKKGSLMPRVAPSLSPETYWLYKNAHNIEQGWSIRAAGLRQRHIDQAQSVNLYITNEFTFSKVLSLYVKAWEEGVKSIYYVRSRSLEVEECESCSS